MASFRMTRILSILLLSLLPLAVAQIDRTGWTATTDSFQPGNEPANVLDNNPSTFWHTEFNPTNAALPHNIVINMNQVYNVNGVSYLPRQDGISNGNIGQHTIELSLDGTNWATPVVIGAYLDDNSTKRTTFQTKPAQLVRLTALSEAGARGPWTSAAEINVFSTSTYTLPPTSLGEWGPTVDFPVVPVAAAVLHDTGRVLVWSSWKANDFGGSPGGLTQTADYDPTSGVISQRTVTNTQHDMFCPGLSLDATGRPIVTGGINSEKTSIYDPGADNWVAASNMQISRGYQSQATLSDGRIFTIGGSWSGGTGGKNGEIYNPTSNLWALLSGCPVAPMLTNDAQGVYRQDNHGWLFGWKEGSVFQAGPSMAMNWYGTTGSGSQQSAGPRASDPDAMNGNAVMYDAANGKILTTGGSPNYQQSSATGNAHVITIGAPGDTPTVETISSMAYTRAFANSVVLPDGKVVIIGGQAYAVPFTDDTAAMSPEIWDPTTSTFTTLNAMAIPRTYHSVALLMPDATVLSGGGGLCGGCTTNHLDAEIFSPPYLFNGDGTLAARPTISSVAPTVFAAGATVVVQADTAVSSFSLIRYGSATHSVDTDQRRIALTPSVSGNTFTLSVTNDSGIAIPGYWMLFAVDGAGVPSVAQTVLIQSA